MWTLVLIVTLMTGGRLEIDLVGFDSAETCLAVERQYQIFDYPGAEWHSVEHYCEKKADALP